MSETLDHETLFPPRPGGMVDTARQRTQAEADQAAAIPEPPPVAGKLQVPVNDHGAELARARTFSVSTANNNPVVELLGRDERRRNAVVLTLEQPVVISFSQIAAQDPQNAVNAAGLPANGFVLPAGVSVTLPTKSGIWCTAMSATATRVSVAAFTYAES